MINNRFRNYLAIPHPEFLEEEGDEGASDNEEAKESEENDENRRLRIKNSK